jgi:afadin
MKMLTATAFSLFEVFSNGDEHQLKANDKPLLVQLNWHKDDREGRFLLRRDSSDQLPGLATAHLPDTTPEKPISFKVKRQLSKKDKGREKRDNIKERTQSVRLRPTSTDDASLNLSATGQASVAEALYDELPESTLMRSISNPEAVMRRRRQQKFEKKLQLYRKNGENSGDLLRVYAEMLCPEFPYKTLLVTVKDTAEVVVKEAVDKFGLGKQNWKDFYLVLSSMSVTGAKRTWRPGPERVIEKDEFPLKIKQEWASMKSEPSFHLRKRPCFTCNPTSLPAHQYKQLSSVESNQETSQETDDLPYLIEVTPEGHMTPDAVKFKLQPNVTQIGSEQARSATGGLAVNLSQLLLPFADIQPRHCKLASMSGVVTLTPLSPQAVTFINGERVSETTLLQNRSTIQFGNSHTFLYVDPRQAKWPVRAAPPPPRHQSFSAVIHSNGLVPQQHKARTLSERSSSHPVKTTYNGQPQEVAKSDFNVSYPSESAKQKVIGPGGERRSLDRSAVNDASTHIGTSAFMKPSKTNMRTNSERRPSASSGDTSVCQSPLKY